MILRSRFHESDESGAARPLQIRRVGHCNRQPVYSAIVQWERRAMTHATKLIMVGSLQDNINVRKVPIYQTGRTCIGMTSSWCSSALLHYLIMGHI